MGVGSFNPNGGTGTIGGEAYIYSPVNTPTNNNSIQTVSPAMGVNADNTTTPNASNMGGMTLPMNNPAYSNVGITSPAMSVNPDGTTTPNAPYMPIMGNNPSAQQGMGGLSSLIPQQPMYSGAQSTNNALQSFIGSNTNPYANATSPYFQAANAQTLGNIAGAQSATQANRVNQNTAYGGLQYQQGVDQYGNPTWTANQTTNPQTQALINSSLGNLQSAQNNPLYGINPGQTYSDAIMQRLAPQLAQQSESNAAALANQGIVPGTQAYENAMRTFQQGQNDLRTSAQIQGMQTGLQAQSLLGTQAGQIKNLATPTYINAPAQAAVSGPDYMGALATQTNANIAAQNAALGQATSNTAGLYGLGSAGILGLAANPGIVSSIGTGLGKAYDWWNAA